MPNDVKLIVMPCPRPGYERYQDLYAVWTYEGKVFYCRVRAQFQRETKYLVARALKVPNGEPFEKYI